MGIRWLVRQGFIFPPDFMLQLSPDEFESVRFHSGASSSWGGRRYLPYAFTEHRAIMLANVLTNLHTSALSKER